MTIAQRLVQAGHEPSPSQTAIFSALDLLVIFKYFRLIKTSPDQQFTQIHTLFRVGQMTLN